MRNSNPVGIIVTREATLQNVYCDEDVGIPILDDKNVAITMFVAPNNATWNG